jgi:hypothetical protein
MTKVVDVLIGVLCAMSVGFFLGYDAGQQIGRQNEQEKVNTECRPQKGNMLTAVIQKADGVQCVYAHAYGTAKTTRRAE